MIKIIKSLLPFTLKRAFKEHLGVPSLHWSLLNLKKKGFYPNVVIDVGAYEGYWTKEFLEVFQNAAILMIEAQESKEAYLKKIVRNNKNVTYSIALLSGEDDKKVIFNENETGSQINVMATEDQMLAGNNRTTLTIDTLLTKLNYPMPNFLKIDVQGHEIEVLKGASKSLATVEVCLLEVTLISFGDGSPLISELINFMDSLNFQMYDVSQFIRRPFDRAMYQMDVFFVKKYSPWVTDRRWN